MDFSFRASSSRSSATAGVLAGTRGLGRRDHRLDARDVVLLHLHDAGVRGLKCS